MVINDGDWLVVWNMNFNFPDSWDDDPIWRTHIFQGGGETTNQIDSYTIVIPTILLRGEIWNDWDVGCTRWSMLGFCFSLTRRLHFGWEM